jgi:hypothetical protein
MRRRMEGYNNDDKMTTLKHIKSIYSYLLWKFKNSASIGGLRLPVRSLPAASPPPTVVVPSVRYGKSVGTRYVIMRSHCMLHIFADFVLILLRLIPSTA